MFAYRLFSDMMVFRFLLLGYITSWTCGSKDAASIIDRIPEVIDVFCPDVNVCRENRSPNTSSVTLKQVFWSCCTGMQNIISIETHSIHV
jgi:hypothetical protein